MENRNALAVSGVYVLYRNCLGGFAMAGIIDSKGTDKGLLARTVAIPIDPALEGWRWDRGRNPRTAIRSQPHIGLRTLNFRPQNSSSLPWLTLLPAHE